MTWATRVLTLVASLLLMLGLWIPARFWVTHGLLQRAWDQTSRQAVTEPQWPWSQSWPAARLTIPSLHRSYAVMDGQIGLTPADGPGRLTVTRLPGQPDTMVIAVHAGPSVRGMERLKPGDILCLTRPRQQPVTYDVVARKRVGRGRLSGMLMTDGAGPGARLLLIARAPAKQARGRDSLRYLVEARLRPEGLHGT